MRVYGLVKDANTHEPIAGARVVLAIGDMELAALTSDTSGRFEYREEPQYIGQLLKCFVDREGYEPREVHYKVARDEIDLEVIELVPEGIELRLSLKDETKNPLEGVKITLEVDGEQVGIGFSDKSGFLGLPSARIWKGIT